MKILYVAQHIQSALGGAERSTLKLIEEVNKKGHSCKSICQQNIHESDVKSLAEEADVIATQLTWTPTAEHIAQNYNKPLIYFFHSWEYICHVGHTGIIPSNCGQQCFHCEYRNKNFRPAYAITNSLYSQEVLRSQHNIDSNHIYPFIDFDSVRVTYRQPLFITMPRIHYMKGTDRFFEIAQRMPKAKFRIVGYGERPRVLPDNVIICGHMNPKDFYKDTLVWLSPFRFESFGMTFIEAQYNNIPVLASNICAVKTDGLIKNGETVDNPDNIDEWVDKLNLILENYSQYNCPELASKLTKKFNINDGADKLIEICEMVKSRHLKEQIA